MDNIQLAIESYVKKLQEYSDKEFKENYPNSWEMGMAPKFEFTIGKKWYKILKTDPSSKAVFCFIDPATGDIYKPAGFNTPAKGKRGNINDAKPPLTGGSLYR